MVMKALFLLFSLFTLTTAHIPGKFCGDIIGNPLNVTLSKNMANVSANIFGNKMSCDYEQYSLKKDNIVLNNSKNDCLETYLNTHGACPCPPDIKYNGHSLIIDNTPIGNIILKSC